MPLPAQTVRFGSFQLDLRAAELQGNGTKVKLPEQPFQILCELIEHPGEVVTREELRQRLWRSETFVDFEHGLNTAVKRLRDVLGDSADNPRYIETLPRHGYRLIVPVEEPEQTATSTLVVGRRWRFYAALGAFLIVAVAVGLVWRQRRLERLHAVKIESLAVLPLENLSGNPEDEYFADGMTEALITELGKVHALRVISRQSVMQYRGTNKTIPEIARDLNVDAVVEGSALRVGGRVRITTQLLQTRPERNLWSESYERDLTDVLSLQSEVARAIASQIRAEVTPQEQSRLARQPPVNPEAYALYLQGRALWARDTDADNRASIAVLERAVAIDPNFAPGHAALGQTYVDRLFGWEPKDEWKSKAEAAIDKALALDPNLAEAHVSRAALLFTPAHGWQYEKAIQECRRALALNPNLAEAHLLLGGVLFHIGIMDEAVHELRTASAISPSLADAGLYIGLALIFDGKFQDALPFLHGLPDSRFSKTLQALDLWEMGRQDEAWAIVDELLKADPQEKFAPLACLHTLMLAGSGKGSEADERINEKILSQIAAMNPYGHYHHFANFIAETYAQLNKPAQAVAWLQKTAETGFPCYPFFEHDPSLDPIRQDPRFLAFMQNLKPEWEYFMSTYGSHPTALSGDNR